ncbi:MAG: hypothetical protein ACRDPG_08650 [Nocardioidaceae bacterium]
MDVLWWLVPPLVATCLAMGWVAWAGRERDEIRRDDSDAALARMSQALAKPAPGRGAPTSTVPVEPTHGVAVRRTARRPASAGSSPR